MLKISPSEILLLVISSSIRVSFSLTLEKSELNSKSSDGAVNFDSVDSFMFFFGVEVAGFHEFLLLFWCFAFGRLKWYWEQCLTKLPSNTVPVRFFINLIIFSGMHMRQLISPTADPSPCTHTLAGKLFRFAKKLIKSSVSTCLEKSVVNLIHF